jgi:ankyrin repeat protein
MKMWFGAILLLLLIACETQAQGVTACDHFQAQALANEIERLKESLDQGANIECRDPVENDATALIKAASAGSVDAVQILLRRGALINARDKSGWTALHHARIRHEALSKAGPTMLGVTTRLEVVMEMLKAAKATE